MDGLLLGEVEGLVFLVFVVVLEVSGELLVVVVVWGGLVGLGFVFGS